MNRLLITEAVEALWGPSNMVSYSRIGDGMINYSFCIEHKEGHKVFLQQINKNVFSRPELIINNLQVIYYALEQRNSSELIARPLPFMKGDLFFCDSTGSYWRASEYIPSKTYHRAERPEQLIAAVKSIAQFTALLSDMDTRLLEPTLPDFHNLSLRFKQFIEAAEKGDPERILESAPLIEALLERKQYVTLYEDISNSPGDFIQRVMHHDAKLSNLLFDLAGEKVVAIADLDTTMPGFFFSDLGDMVRSMVASFDENGSDPQNVIAIPEAYSLLYENYRLAMQDRLTTTEQSLLHSAGLLMIYMQALRFLTDHLQEDSYYQIQRPNQNKDRALHQYHLLCSLEVLQKKKYQFSLR